MFVVLPTGNSEPLARPAVSAVDDPAQPDGVTYDTAAPHVFASLFVSMFAW